MMQRGSDDFSEEGFRQLIRRFKNIGYRFCNFHDVVPDKPDIIMRHDIDMSLAYARTVAEMEAEEGIKASYYVMVCTEFYNLIAPANRSALKRIFELGHEVGLHFDTSAYAQQRDTLEAAAMSECQILESLIDGPVRSISFHRPAKELQGLEGNFAGRLHTYQPRFFSGLEYCTDSDRHWKYGHPLEREAIKMRKAMHLVTHPIWWCSGADMNVIDKIETFRREREAFLVEELRRNLKPYAAHVKKPKSLTPTFS